MLTLSISAGLWREILRFSRNRDNDDAAADDIDIDSNWAIWGFGDLGFTNGLFVRIALGPLPDAYEVTYFSRYIADCSYHLFITKAGDAVM